MARPIASVLCAALVCCRLGAGEDPTHDHLKDAPQPALKGYDPTRGIDDNGRIPRVVLPVDLPNPERWRYIPEGRIAPGNVFERFLITSFIAPFVYYQDDIGYGAGVSISDIDFREQRRRERASLAASATTEGQERYSIDWRRYLLHRDLPGGGVVVGERDWLRVKSGYERTRTRRFFGLGPDTDEGDESNFTDEATFIGALRQWTRPDLGADLIFTAGTRFEHHNLTAGRDEDVRSTTEVEAGLVAEGDSHDSGWVTIGVAWDSRDSQHQPYRGWRLAGQFDAAPVQSGGDAGGIGELRAAITFPLPSPWHNGGDAGEANPPTDGIAFGLYAAATAGDLPFHLLPWLGSPDTLRGYPPNRFTDRAAWHAGVEYRTWLIPRGFKLTNVHRVERIGLAVFYELGTVAPSPAALPDAEIHHSYGISLRAAFERTALVRVDLGFSDEGTTVSAESGVSF